MPACDLPEPLRTLLAEFPLPPGWELSAQHSEEVAIDRTRIRLFGVVAEKDGGDVTGSAAEFAESPVARAYFELLERCALLDAITSERPTYELWGLERESLGYFTRAALFPESPPGAAWGYAKSNGVAAGRTWREACEAARLELLERDRVLRSWYGATPPERLVSTRRGALEAFDTSYALERYLFPASCAAVDGVQVAAVFGFPKARGVPFVCGFGAGHELSSALAKAEREWLQGAGFLAGEEIPERAPLPSASPSYHQELFLFPEMHARVRAWLAGAHADEDSNEQPLPVRSQPCFVDLTPTHLVGRMAIARAIPDAELPLTFGVGHPRVAKSRADRFGAHPIS